MTDNEEYKPIAESVKFLPNEIVSIDGVLVSAELLRAFTQPTRPGYWLRITKTDDGRTVYEQRKFPTDERGRHD